MPKCMIPGEYAIVHDEKNPNDNTDQFLYPRCFSKQFIFSVSLNLHNNSIIG